MNKREKYGMCEGRSMFGLCGNKQVRMDEREKYGTCEGRSMFG